MKKLISMTINKIWLIIMILAAVFAGYQCISKRSVSLESFLAFCTAPDGYTIASWYEDDVIVTAQISAEGKIEKNYSFQAEADDSMYQVQGISAGEEFVYMLRNRADKYNGKILEQQLVVIDYNSFLMAKETKVFDLENEENYQYRWLNANADTVTLIATDQYETTAIRETYEFGAVLENTLSLKNSRTYPLKEEEGIYKAIVNSKQLVYISDSGKIYSAADDVKEIYPARKLNVLMYPSYISYAETGYVYFGEHETGDIIKLNITDGSEEVVWSGSSPFFGTGLYTPKDVIEMSMSSLNNFTALVKNGQTGTFQFLTVQDGQAYVIDEFEQSNIESIRIFLRFWISFFIIVSVAYLLLKIFVSSIKGGHTIMERLISATVPMLLVTMVVFGFVSFSYYGKAIDDNFEKQVVDEGNMLAALFGQDSFNEIEYPYDYTGEAYDYLNQQMATRDLYTRAIYYENGKLYIGVDKNNPCFYPVDILMNINAEKLYEKAALTGEAVTGIIQDRFGERYVCITPIGGLSGQTIYLLETGVYTASIDSYTASYIKDFAIMSAAFLIIVAVILMILFYRILFPIGEIKREMQKFADGDRSIRIHTSSEDELTGITQVFNKMADDIDVQILNLERMSATYYRFVPQSIIELLGKDNLGSLTLGSNVKGNYPVLNVRLYLKDGLSLDQTEAMMNRFFNTVNRFAEQNGIISIVDDANLQSIIMICQNGAEAAVVTALTILARIDADNQKYAANEQIHVGFVLDTTDVYFGICGDEERYIPVILAPEFEKLLSNKKFLKNMGSRLLVTKTAYEMIENVESYAHRYVGRLVTDEMDVGMYDVYDDRNAEQIRIMKTTQHVFDKAMELYEKGYYYEAKNLYAMVLRENQQDKVAKYYIFRCEELQDS